jgi:acetyl-CoA C-acetyltransferase
MTDAVIVSTARTGLAKSWRGGFNMTHGATLGGHATQAAVERAKLDPARVEDVIMGCDGRQHRAANRTARRFAGQRAGHDGEPFLLVGFANNRLGCTTRDRR